MKIRKVRGDLLHQRPTSFSTSCFPAVVIFSYKKSYNTTYFLGWHNKNNALASLSHTLLAYYENFFIFFLSLNAFCSLLSFSFSFTFIPVIIIILVQNQNYIAAYTMYICYTNNRIWTIFVNILLLHRPFLISPHVLL